MGTSTLFVFCVLFFAVEALVLYNMQSSINPLFEFDNAIMALNPEPPKEPNFDGSPLAFISNTTQAIAYIAAMIVYVVSNIFSMFAYPFLLAGKVFTFSGKYPFLSILNGTIAIFLAYSIYARIMGGD